MTAPKSPANTAHDAVRENDRVAALAAVNERCDALEAENRRLAADFAAVARAAGATSENGAPYAIEAVVARIGWRPAESAHAPTCSLFTAPERGVCDCADVLLDGVRVALGLDEDVQGARVVHEARCLVESVTIARNQRDEATAAGKATRTIAADLHAGIGHIGKALGIEGAPTIGEITARIARLEQATRDALEVAMHRAEIATVDRLVAEAEVRGATWMHAEAVMVSRHIGADEWMPKVNPAKVCAAARAKGGEHE